MSDFDPLEQQAKKIRAMDAKLKNCTLVGVCRVYVSEEGTLHTALEPNENCPDLYHLLMLIKSISCGMASAGNQILENLGFTAEEMEKLKAGDEALYRTACERAKKVACITVEQAEKDARNESLPDIETVAQQGESVAFGTVGYREIGAAGNGSTGKPN